MFFLNQGLQINAECHLNIPRLTRRTRNLRSIRNAKNFTHPAKTDERLQNSGELTGFNFCGEDFPIVPKTAFYDWLYITALYQKKKEWGSELDGYKGFSDIVFNPKNSLNCQARAAALFVSLSKNQLIDAQMFSDKDYYLTILTGSRRQLRPVESTPQQLSLPFGE